MKIPIHSFELKSPSDMLAKAKRELTRLLDADSSLDANGFVSDHALNFAITAWHIADWIWKKYNPNNSKNLQILQLKSPYEWQAFLRRESDALAICYEIATGSKHMSLDKDQRYQPRVGATELSAGVATASQYSVKVLKVELPNGERKRATDVFSDAVRFWDTFFEKYNIS